MSSPKSSGTLLGRLPLNPRGPGTTGFSRPFKKPSFKMADSQSKNSNKSIVFRRNIDQYSLGEQGKDAEFLPCPEAKLKELTLSKCK